jgi:hypothetical protein
LLGTLKDIGTKGKEKNNGRRGNINFSKTKIDCSGKIFNKKIFIY